MPDVAGTAVRIKEMRVVPYALPFRVPFTTARQTLRERHGSTVWLGDDSGRWGVGEAAPLAGFGMETPTACDAALRGWRRTLLGKTVQMPRAWSADLPDLLGVPPAPSRRPAASFSLECALLDLASQVAGMPLAKWFHPGASTHVPVNATLGATSPDEAARQARDSVAAGFATLKLKVGVGGADADVARVQAVRSAVGPAVKLRVDANEGWDESEALAVLRRLAPFDLEYAEQPVPADDLAALARLRAKSPVPIASDEASSSETGARAVLQAHACSVLVLKPMAIGGVLATLRIAQEAFALGVPVVLTSMLDGFYGRTATLHAAAALPALAQGRVPSLACGLATGHLLAQDLVERPTMPVAGRLAVPTGAGAAPP